MKSRETVHCHQLAKAGNSRNKFKVLWPEPTSSCRIETPQRILETAFNHQIQFSKYASSSSRGRMICLHAIIHVVLPACDPFSQRRHFIVSPQDMAEASMLPFSCRSSSAIATLGSNRSLSSEISPDQGMQCSACRRLTSPRELTEILSPMYNTMA